MNLVGRGNYPSDFPIYIIGINFFFHEKKQDSQKLRLALRHKSHPWLRKSELALEQK